MLSRLVPRKRLPRAFKLGPTKIFAPRYAPRIHFISFHSLYLKIMDPGPWLCLHISELMDWFAQRIGKDYLSLLSMYEYFKTKFVLNQSVYYGGM